MPNRLAVNPLPRARHLAAAAAALVVGLLFLSVSGRADVRLPALFTENMVLQQGQPLPIWGWADANEKVTVVFRDQKVSVESPAGGKWRLNLKPEKAGGPDLLVVEGRNRIEIGNVLVGEVWICSGQSNMEWSMNRSYEADEDIANSTNPNLRLFRVPKLKALVPVDAIEAEWRLCSPETTPGFSAVAYYFGRALQQARKTPVGLIQTAWGGSPAEVWMSQAVLSAVPEYRRDILEKGEDAMRRYETAVLAWEKARDEAKARGAPFEKRRPGQPWRPTELYNGMIAPLIPYAFKGAIWYQGESNASRAWQYRTLFPDMIRNWRRDWGRGDFPFLAVQLAPWDKNRKRSIEEITREPVNSDWPELREAQAHATRVLPKVELAVITDVGDKDDIHPTKKEPVGERLALAARVIAYGERIDGLSPTFKSVRFRKGVATVSFKDAGRGLEARGGELTGFALAGEGGDFVWADATVKGKRVVVSSPRVEKPVAVRFGWADYPVVNLFTRDGLPVSPFRTDDFPMVTAPKD